MIPSHFRKSVAHRKLYATMQFLVQHDAVGPITKGAADRQLQKAAVDRHRTLLERHAEDAFADYFREEQAHVVDAVKAGRSPAKAIDALADDLRETYEATWRRSAEQWGEWVGRRSPVAVKANDWGAPIDEWLRKNVGKKITGITEASRKKIAAQIAAGVKEGEGVATIAKRISKFYLEDIIPNRALVIARTEVGSAINWMQNYVASSLDVPMEKEWLSLSDERVRDDHRDASGQVQPMDEPFLVGDDELMYPGDPTGSPEEVINCRCTVLHRVVEPSPGHKSARPPSPAEFAADVVGVENADVATAMAYMKGVFSDADEWTRARKILMKHVFRLRRAAAAVDVEKFNPWQPRDEHGRWTGTGAGGVNSDVPVDESYSAENQKLAEQYRKFPNGTELRYVGGSKVAINVGEHVKVTGVYGMAEKTGVIYYTVQAQGNRRFTLASTTMRPPLPGETPAAPAPKAAPKPKAPAAPTPEGQPGQPTPKPSATPAHHASYASATTPAEVGAVLQDRVNTVLQNRGLAAKVSVDLSAMKDRDVAVKAAAEYERLASKYPLVASNIRNIEAVPLSRMPNPDNTSAWAAAGREQRKIWINAEAFDSFGTPDGQNLLDIGVQTRWHPPGCNTVESVIAHEFGHHVDYSMETPGSPAFDANWVIHRQSSYNRKLLTRVSEYAVRKAGKTGTREGVAEAFAQYEEQQSGRYKKGLHPAADFIGKYISDRQSKGRL